ncbi:hypothetical protein L596_028885 [Steinernema carpocapsae]|uniref:Uncharacterized protein n=1 Tax=Steinernema carpocapsae TaxID=34508 RepID=A0A4U5LZP9_STECR|nr:hypothetical protein L596_028885 [Steinernema carpocapsae]
MSKKGLKGRSECVTFDTSLVSETLNASSFCFLILISLKPTGPRRLRNACKRKWLWCSTSIGDLTQI